MLPLAVSLRRLARRSSTILLRHAVPTSNSLQSVRIVATVPSYAWYSSSPVNMNTIENIIPQVEETQDMILEPLEGFIDQKPIQDFALSQETQRHLLRAGITHLFPVQTQSFDLMMKGTDIMGRSKTGSGKTLAFALPIIETILANKKDTRNPQALVLLPTRELAQQVHDQIHRVAPQLRTINVVGGVSYTYQESQLRRGVDILVGTPGRIQDLVTKGSLILDEIDITVLDEADMMLKFGFQEAVETLLGYIRTDGQTIMWSATFPKWVNQMAQKFLKNAVTIDLVGTDENHVPNTVTHEAIHASRHDRLEMLATLLRFHGQDGQTLVFTETKQEADDIVNTLASQDVRVLHGDLSQGMRTTTMNGFRTGKVKTLVCTDIAARGLDIANVDLVVQYRLPNDKESFVHRAGRTGRAGRSGTNVVFFDRNEAHEMLDFQRRYKFQFQHVSLPHPEEMITHALADVTKQLGMVSNSTRELFDDVANRMIEENGANGLSAALAVLCGFDSKKIMTFSMLTGRHRMQTIQVEGDLNARELNRTLVDVLDDRADIHPLDDRTFVFDIPHGKLQQLQDHFAIAAPNVQVKVASKFSQLVVEKTTHRMNNTIGRYGRNGRKPSRNFTNNRFGQSSTNRFDGQKNGQNWKRNDRDQYNRRNSRRDSDTSFSKPRASNRNTFGRFIDKW
ncbi:dead deah box rna [Plasmopara halstedii]|uniref:Dead deah box rna n=1 Tax=Plasmopara halstedii TaxID=4781 RepID=A0A0P1B6W7_PLAHL|nr:dead deah box rna [Plasmopara halstedii]CEG49519.1 dead deah box rna [Plasmopara halstedii]|eukprot:XP_024585888.1 dead deah box rna [Plasmopara halstedii]